MRERWYRTAEAVVRVRAEVATALAFLAGWTLITYGVAVLTSPLAWVFSGGLLCLSLGGWRLLGVVVIDGMYALTRKDTNG